MASATTAGFRPVNMNLLVQDGSSSSKIIDENTPTTPKPSARFADADRKAKTPATSNPITPTRHDFGGIPGQRALPNTPFAPADIADTRTHSREAPGLAREDSHKSIHSQSQMSDGSGDVEMADEDEVEQEDSDNDSVTSDSQRPTKKKKGQRFFCTDFSPCNLSFTRSEHLARHIRSAHSLFCQYLALTDMSTENTPASDHSSVIVAEDSPDSTISDSTPRLCMSMKISLVIRWRPPALVFNVRYALIG